MTNTQPNEKFKPVEANLPKAVEFAFGLPTVMMHLTAIDPSGKRPIVGKSFPKTASGKAAALKWVEQAHKGGYGIYFNCNEVKPPLGPGHAKASEADISTVHFLHVDIDPPEGTPADKIETVRARMVSKIKAAEPSLIINSGNGFGAFFAVEPVTVTDENRDSIKARNIALADQLGGDDCEDLCRVMRLPYTINRPNAKKAKAGRVPVLADIVVDDRDFTAYTLDSFQSAAVSKDDPSVAEKPSASGTAYETIGEPEIPETVDLSKLDDVLRSIIEKGPPEGYSKSRSEAVYMVACDLRRIGWSDGAILGVLTEPMNAIADHIFDQKQREPIEQASRIIADMNRRGIAQVYSDNPGDDFADEPVEPITLDKKTAAKVEAQKEARTKSRDSFGFDFAHGPNVKMRTIDWIWKDHLALGQHTCIAGVQGDGKSQLVYALAAAVTKGSEWPGTEQKAPKGKVILLNAEDTTEDVMIPRLLAAGADIDKVYIVQAVVDKNGKRRKFNLQADLVNLTKLADKLGDVKLITFDPVSSYLGGDLDSHENTHLRDALDPITEMASRTGAAVISVTHFNKSAKGVTALNRVMGGAGFTAAPRAAFAVIRDAKNPLTRMMLSLKSNLAAEGAAYGMCFTLSTKDVGADERNGNRIVAPHVVWGDKTTMSADEALAANNEKLKTPTALNEAKGFLTQMLAAGPKLAREVQAAAAKRDIAEATLRRAREALDVIAEKVEQRDGRGPWMWSLPDGAITPTEDGKVILPAPLADPDDEPDFEWLEARAEFAEPYPGDDPVADLM
jgi:putative DNA primase/helicase